MTAELFFGSGNLIITNTFIIFEQVNTIDGDDPGTAVETGIAYALGKPVSLYSTEFSKLRKGVDISNVYPIDVLPANSHQYWITQNEPLINNMLLGVSNKIILNTPIEVLNWVNSFNA